MRRYFFILCMVFSSVAAFGQTTRNIYGCVLGEDGAPMQGAHIYCDGKEVITTHLDGQFTCDVPVNARYITVKCNEYYDKKVELDGSYMVIRMQLDQEIIAQREAERLEAERLEAERLEAERLEAERLEAERREAERLEKERIKKEEQEQQKLERARLNAEFAKSNKGFQHTISVGFDAIFNEPQQGYIGVEYIGGYRFNNRFFAGIGIGVNNHLYTNNIPRYVYNDKQYPLTKFKVPLYLYGRVYFTQKRVQPFVALSVGANICFPLKEDVTQYTKYSTSRLFGEAEIGCNARISGKYSVYVSAGYQMSARASISATSVSSVSVANKLANGFTVKIGLTF